MQTLLPRTETCALTHDFLALGHGSCGFLVNRDQFSASVYLEHSVPLPSGPHQSQYVNSLMSHGGQAVLVYNIDDCLNGLFRCDCRGALRIALIAQTSTFSAGYRSVLESVIERAAPDASPDLFAFRVGSDAEIVRLRLAEVKPMPPTIRSLLQGYGVLGCRFGEHGSVELLVDIVTIAFSHLSKEYRVEAP